MFEPGPARFRDRGDAGAQLAPRLERFRAERPVVVGIARGGVPVAARIARALSAPLEVTVVRKIGAPRNPEFAIGALAEGGVIVLNEGLIAALGISAEQLGALLVRGERQLARRVARYRDGREDSRAPISVRGRTVILVDDGLATGRSASAAVLSLRERGARRVVVATPVAAAESAQALRRYADEVVCVCEPPDLRAVGYWYEDFRPTDDQEVASLLAERDRGTAAG